MGLFSKILNKNDDSNEAFSAEESIFGVIVAIAAADGSISEEEVIDINSMLNKSRTFSNMNPNHFTKAGAKVFKVLNRDGVTILLERSTPSVPKEFHQGLFALICDIAYSDGYIQRDEEFILERVQTAFGLDDNLALNIVDIISKKNQI